MLLGLPHNSKVGESSITAWKVMSMVCSSFVFACKTLITAEVQAAAQNWPDVFDSEQADAKKHQVLKDMQTVRPVIETG